MEDLGEGFCGWKGLMLRSYPNERPQRVLLQIEDLSVDFSEEQLLYKEGIPPRPPRGFHSFGGGLLQTEDLREE